MTKIEETNNGLGHLHAVLKERPTTVTRTSLWRVPHKTSDKKEVELKIGRYHKIGLHKEKPENEKPKSVLTLDNDEFQELIKFLSENYEPFKEGIKEYVPLNKEFNQERISHLKAIFNNPDKQEILDFVIKNNILPDDLIISLQNQTRRKAIREFEAMLEHDLIESEWQKWFKANDWVLGSEFVRILDERIIDVEHIADYLMQAYDGFLDIVELKRPGGGLDFWRNSEDHNNLIPSSELIKAVTQATKYIHEIEREVDSIKFFERVGGIRTIKPRCILIFGRSHEWNDEQKESYRILNSCYHNLTILTYDHILCRAKRMLGMQEKEVTQHGIEDGISIEDIPF